MAKKSDIINSFIQAKNNKKNRKQSKNQTINRLLGSQVLHTNQIIKVSKLKNIQGDELSRRTIHHGFTKTISEMRDNLSRPEQQASKVIHNRCFEAISFVINSILLNPTVTARAFVIFFAINISYYSVCIIYDYYYNPLVVVILLIVSFVTGLLSLGIKRSK